MRRKVGMIGPQMQLLSVCVLMLRTEHRLPSPKDLDFSLVCDTDQLCDSLPGLAHSSVKWGEHGPACMGAKEMI